MFNLDNIYLKAQKEMNQLGDGYCLLVQLINYQELLLINQDINHVLKDFVNIVESCAKKSQLKIHYHYDKYKVFLIIADTTERYIDNLVFDIYRASQVYSNDRCSVSYMNCKIANFKFTVDNKVSEIYNLLSLLIINDKYGKFHIKYSEQQHDINLLKNYNIRLNHLRKALANNTIAFAYQPIIERTTGHTHYYECLLRLPDEHNNMVSVGPIIEAAEDKGLINLIDHTVLEMAINELVKYPDVKLSVNISNFGLIDESLVNLADQLLTKNKVANRLILEITETSMNKDYPKTKKVLDYLHSLGCRFALDDFGAGFTSFKQLQSLPIDIIKIDGSYIKNVLQDWYSQYFVTMLITLSEELGIKTVAEFVENGEIAKFLVDIKIDAMQGNFFSPAVNNRLYHANKIV